MITKRTAILAAVLIAPVGLMVHTEHAAAANCAIFAAVPGQASGNLPPPNAFYLAVNDPYASQYGAVNNAASLTLDQGSATPRPGFAAIVKSASCAATSATISLTVTRGNGSTFKVGDPMTVSLVASGRGQAMILDNATRHLVSLNLTTLVLLP